MADATPVKRGFWWGLKDFAISAVTALGLDIAMKEFAKSGAAKAAEKGVEEIHKKVFQDKRAQLLDDLRKMAAKDPKSIENLLRRHKKSIDDLNENRFVDLLLKVCPDGESGRAPNLKFLNDVDDDLFDQFLYMLDHDVVLQWWERIRRRSSRIAAKDIAEFKNLLRTIDGHAAPQLALVANWLKTK
jgi:hypothetical protein